jgi:hypothetical protein
VSASAASSRASFKSAAAETQEIEHLEEERAITGNVKQREAPERTAVFLTALGGGAFGNRTSWIKTALQRALDTEDFADVPLDVSLVHYGTRVPTDFADVGIKRKKR